LSQIAEGKPDRTCDVYNYCPDVEAILALTERHVTGNLEHLADVRIKPVMTASGSLSRARTYALIAHHPSTRQRTRALVHRW